MEVVEGDRVALEEYVPCGACKWCRSEDFRFCEATDIAGHGPRLWYGSTPIDHATRRCGAATASTCTSTPTPSCTRCRATSPPPTPRRFCPSPTASSGPTSTAQVGLGDAILIQGPGQQGLACVLAAKAAGASCIIVSGLSRDRQRLDVACKLGADYVIDVENEDIVAKVMDYTGGEGVNVAVNVTGGGKTTVAEAIQVASQALQHRPCRGGQGNDRGRQPRAAQDRYQAGQRTLLQVRRDGDPDAGVRSRAHGGHLDSHVPDEPRPGGDRRRRGQGRAGRYSRQHHPGGLAGLRNRQAPHTAQARLAAGDLVVQRDAGQRRKRPHFLELVGALNLVQHRSLLKRQQLHAAARPQNSHCLQQRLP